MIDQRKLIVAALSELCKRSFYRFFLEFWEVISDEELVENWHIKYLCDQAQEVAEAVIERREKPHDLCVNVPPGESKSSIFSVLLPCWIWAKDDTIKMITASYEGTLAQLLNVKSTDVLRSDKYKLLFPNVRLRKDKASKKYIGLVGGGERFAVGSKGNMTGKHGHMIIIDDPMNPKAAHSEPERIAVNGWVSGTVASRKINKRNAPMMMIMQRLHDEDTTKEFLTKFTNVKHICLPARVSDDVAPKELLAYYKNGLFNPERLSEATLQDYEKLDNFEGQFMQTPLRPGGNILKRLWFKFYSIGELLKRAEQVKAELVWNFCVDGAYTKNTENAATVCIAWCYFQNRIYIRGIYRKWVSITEFIDDIPDFLLQNGYSKKSTVWVEPKASGLDLIDAMVVYKGINAVQGDAPTNDKITAAHGITTVLRAERVLLEESCDENEAFLKECEMFPKYKWKDQVDTLVMIVDRAINSIFVNATN